MTSEIIADDIVLPKQQTLIALSAVAKSLKSPPSYIKAARAGQRLSQFKGRGMEFDEARPYQPGDDIRAIDWKVTARTQKTHTKVFRQERERPVYVWVDNRASMHFGTQHCYKSVQAAQIASLIAWNTIAQSDRVGGMVFSEQQHKEIKPKMGRNSVLQLIHFLSDSEQNQLTETSDDVLNHAFYRLRQMVKPSSLIYLISDFNGFTDHHNGMIAQLTRHNDVGLVHVYDTIEQSLPPSGIYHLSSIAEKLCIQTKNQKVRAEYEQAFNKKQNALENLSQKHKMRFISVATHDSPIEKLKQWLSH